MKAYYIRVLVILLLVALLCTITACQSEKKTLSADEQQEISDAWLAQKGIALDWSAKDICGVMNVRFYGEYNGYAVIFAESWECICGAMHKQKVADFVFSDSQPFELAVYKNGTLSSLQEAYDNGWLTSDDISCIYEQHNACYPSE